MSDHDTDIHLSFVAPAFNESENLRSLVTEVAQVAATIGESWEFVLVDDCSEDDSAAVLDELMREYPQLRVLTMSPRSGQTAALEAGLRAARGAFIATLDADLQNDPTAAPSMLARIVSGECDMVNGWRKERKDNWVRRLSSKMANRFRNWLIKETIHDAGCGLKVFRREVSDSFKLFNGLHRFFPTLARMSGFTVIEIPVHHRPRVAGIAKYGVWNRAFRAFRDMLALRWMQSRNMRYEVAEAGVERTADVAQSDEVTVGE
jgi:dolichol-phosphate mannosyltransferase